MLRADAPEHGPWLLVEVPDSVPADFASVFRSALAAAGLEGLAGDLSGVTGLPGVADAVGSLCRVGVTVTDSPRVGADGDGGVVGRPPGPSVRT